MEETAIPPLLGIIGHPIAGNPMQFAMERALAAAKLEWRFLSFDVPPERLAAAVAGVDALGFRGLAIAPPHSADVLKLVPQHSRSAEAGQWADAIHRGSDGSLVADNLLADALQELLRGRSIAGASVALLGDAPESRALFASLSLLGPETLFVRDIAAADFARTLQPPPPAASRAAEEPRPRDGAAPSSRPPSSRPLASGQSAEHRGQGAEESGRQAEIASVVNPPGQIASAETAPQEAGGAPQQEGISRSEGESRGEDESRTGGESPEQVELGARHLANVTAEPPQVLRLSDRDKTAFGELRVLIRGGLTPVAAADAKALEKQVERLREDCVVIDLAVCASTSPLLRTASERGLPTISAIDLLVARAALAFHRWTGRQADRIALQEAFEEYLEI